MITSFGDRDTERVFSGEYTKRIPSEIRKRAQRKLDQLRIRLSHNMSGDILFFVLHTQKEK